MILTDIALLCTANRRSRHYLSTLLNGGFTPGFLLILADPAAKQGRGQTSADTTRGLLGFADENRIPCQIVDSIDINGEDVLKAIGERPETIFIYSGPGGSILRKGILSLGKRFLHIHPGRLPEFRGSTTIYYQFLVRGSCSASALFLEEKIDSGPLLAVRDFSPPLPGEDWDYEYDPRIRSELLLEVIRHYVRDGRFSETKQPTAEGETYYIAHPVIRHLARLHAEFVQNR